MEHPVERSYHKVWSENSLIVSTMIGIGNTWGWTCVGNFYSLLFRHPVYEADQSKTINMEGGSCFGRSLSWVRRSPTHHFLGCSMSGHYYNAVRKKDMKKTAATTDRVTLVAVFVCQSLCHSAGWRTALI